MIRILALLLLTSCGQEYFEYRQNEGDPLTPVEAPPPNEDEKQDDEVVEQPKPIDEVDGDFGCLSNVVSFDPNTGETGDGHVVVCHHPPGNYWNYKTIVVGAHAARKHTHNHPGDTLGRCPQAPQSPIYEECH